MKPSVGSCLLHSCSHYHLHISEGQMLTGSQQNILEDTALCALSGPLMVFLTRCWIRAHCLLVTQHLRPAQHNECAAGHLENHQSSGIDKAPAFSLLILMIQPKTKTEPQLGECWPSPWKLRTSTQNGAAIVMVRFWQECWWQREKLKSEGDRNTATGNHHTTVLT